MGIVHFFALPEGIALAKYRHKLFELYEFRDEALEALTSKSSQPAVAPAPSALDAAELDQVSISNAADVTVVNFKEPPDFTERNLAKLRTDFQKIAERLGGDSRVLLDFTGATAVGPPAIELLTAFNQKLRIKGSRMALCCLAPDVQRAFF